MLHTGTHCTPYSTIAYNVNTELYRLILTAIKPYSNRTICHYRIASNTTIYQSGRVSPQISIANTFCNIILNRRRAHDNNRILWCLYHKKHTTVYHTPLTLGKKNTTNIPHVVFYTTQKGMIIYETMHNRFM